MTYLISGALIVLRTGEEAVRQGSFPPEMKQREQQEPEATDLLDHSQMSEICGKDRFQEQQLVAESSKLQTHIKLCAYHVQLVPTSETTFSRFWAVVKIWGVCAWDVLTSSEAIDVHGKLRVSKDLTQHLETCFGDRHHHRIACAKPHGKWSGMKGLLSQSTLILWKFLPNFKSGKSPEAKLPVLLRRVLEKCCGSFRLCGGSGGAGHAIMLLGGAASPRSRVTCLVLAFPSAVLLAFPPALASSMALPPAVLC